MQRYEKRSNDQYFSYLFVSGGFCLFFGCYSSPFLSPLSVFSRSARHYRSALRETCLYISGRQPSPPGDRQGLHGKGEAGRHNGYCNERLEMACLSHKTDLLFHDSFLTIYNDYTFISLAYPLPGKVKDVPVCAAEDAVCAAGNVYASSLYRRESYIVEV